MVEASVLPQERIFVPRFPWEDYMKVLLKLSRIGVRIWAITLGLAAISVVAHAQIQPFKQPGYGCSPLTVTCIDCNLPGATWGCTTPIPAPWNFGACVKAPSILYVCQARTAYDCGFVQLCASLQSLGQPCSNGNICR